MDHGNVLIHVEIKNVYGRELIYPINKSAQLLAELAGKKTFDRKDMKIMKEIGFDILVKTQETIEF